MLCQVMHNVLWVSKSGHGNSLLSTSYRGNYLSVYIIEISSFGKRKGWVSVL